MDYSGIVKKSFEIAWTRKSLWFFGLFVAGGTGFNLDLPGDDLPGSLEDIDAWLHPSGTTIIAVLGLIASLLGLYLLLNSLCSPALIDAVNRITRGGTYRFKDSLASGVDFFLRYLGLIIVAFFAETVAIGFIGGITVLFFLVNTVLGVLSLLVVIPLAIGLFALLWSVFFLSERALVVRNVSIADSIIEGYRLLRANLGRCLIMFLIYVGLSIGLGIGAGLLVLIVALPVSLMVAATGAGLLAGIMLGIILALPFSVVVGGFTGTALSSSYTLFYFGLVEPGGTTATPAVVETGTV
ncbi:MAG: hypothetical protein ACE5FH_05830 [Candidatus Zixiibacteriota bacterium]